MQPGTAEAAIVICFGQHRPSLLPLAVDVGLRALPVKILGSNLTGETSVAFNGTAAAFTVVSRYLVTTTVPVGATTGTVEVVTPGGTLSSNVPFRVP